MLGRMGYIATDLSEGASLSLLAGEFALWASVLQSEWAVTARVYVIAGSSAGTIDRVNAALSGPLLVYPLPLPKRVRLCQFSFGLLRRSQWSSSCLSAMTSRAVLMPLP